MFKMLNKKRNKKGFTLIELVVVIAILGILAAIAVPRLSGSRNTAAIAAHNANVRTLESAATIYLANGGDALTPENVKTAMLADGTGTLQKWPNLPSQLAGKFIQLDGATAASQIAANAEYKVTISDIGKITVEPGLIKVGSKVAATTFTP